VQAHALAVRTIIAALLRQGQVLGTNDIAGMVLSLTVLGAAAAGAVLFALARRRALPTIAESFASIQAAANASR
jgi:hypothetical protein